MRSDIPGLVAQKEYDEPRGVAQLRKPTLRETLLAQKAELTQRLANIDAAIAVLDKMPDFESAMNIIGKVY